MSLLDFGFRRVFDRFGVLRTVAPEKQRAAAMAHAWSAVRNPDLVADLVELGGVLAMQPAEYVEGYANPVPINPQRLSYEAGRRDLAVQLLTLMGVGPAELMSLMESRDVR